MRWLKWSIAGTVLVLLILWYLVGLPGRSTSFISWTSEPVARWVTDPVVAPLLLAIGFGGLVLEIFTGGWGLPGTLGILSLILFFAGHLIAGFAAWPVILLLVFGLILLGIEALIPGFGFFGISGIVAIVASVFFASSSPAQAITSLTVALLAAIGVGIVGAKVGKKRGWWKRLMLADSLNTAGGFVARNNREDLLGKTGKALSPLRPAGVVDIGGERVDAVTEGDFIDAGTWVEVARVDRTRVVVRRREEREQR